MKNYSLIYFRNNSQKPDIKKNKMFSLFRDSSQGEVETFFKMNNIGWKYATLFSIHSVIYCQMYFFILFDLVHPHFLHMQYVIYVIISYICSNNNDQEVKNSTKR